MDFSSIKGKLASPDFQDRLGGIGMALGGLDQGRVVDLSGYRDSIAKRGAHSAIMGNEDLLAQFTPEQRAMLASLPPEAAQQIIAETVFKEPDPAIAFREQLRASGVLDRFSPEQQAVLLSLPPDQAQQVISSTVFAPSPEPTKGVNVGGQLVNPITGEVIYAGRPDPSHRVLTAPEVAAMGLPEGSYQQAPDGKITSIGGGGQSININTGSEVGTIPPGYELFTDPETGARSMRPIAGGPVEQEQATEAGKSTAQADAMLETIDALIADSGLDSAVGPMGAVTTRLGPLAPDAARARSRIEQIQGQAFLQAFESLKGGGQITEVEGKKAEAAIARLNTAQSAADFRAALIELKGVIERAGKATPKNAAPRRLKFNPETGGFE